MLEPRDIIVTDSGLDAVVLVDPDSGDRTVVSGCADASCTSVVGSSTDGAEIASPFGVALGATGELFVVDTILDAVIGIDPATGNRRIVSSAARGTGTNFVSPVGIIYDASDGSLLVVDQTMNEVFRVDPTTGNRTLLPHPAGQVAFDTPWDLTLEDDEFLLVSDTGLDAVFRVSVLDGTREIVSGCVDAGCTGTEGSGDAFGTVRSLAVESGGQIVVTDSGVDSVFRVDPDTGLRTIISSSATGEGRDLEFPLGIAIANDGTLVIADFVLNAIVEVDPLTGDRFLVSFSQRGEGPEFDSPRRLLIVPIPEPGTFVLLALGVLALARSSARSHPVDGGR